MEMEPVIPSAKKIKLADIHEATAERSEEPPAGSEGDGGDLISNLPDAVLGEIISLLPTKDGARTQALARRWRHLWRAAPLNLDLRDLPHDRERRKSLLGAILSAHQGHGRRLCLPARQSLRQPAPHLRQQADAANYAWLGSPALNNLQELELYPASYDYVVPSTTLLRPPVSIFRFSSTLCVATISLCSLLDSTVETLRFPLLRKLALVAVETTECALHSIIVAACPVLESLLLYSIFGVCCLRISSPTLISIGIRSPAPAELIIEDAPLLQRLLLHLDSLINRQISVISAPNLETLGYIPEFYGHSKIMFGSTVIQGSLKNSLTTVVRNVKILAIHMYVYDLDVVIDLLRCFPCLEELYLKRGGQAGKPNCWRQKHRNLLRSLDIRLKTIVIGWYGGIKAQANFAQFFVLNARILESLTLEVEHRDYNDEFFAEQHRILQMEKRASTDARLCFKKNASMILRVYFVSAIWIRPIPSHVNVEKWGWPGRFHSLAVPFCVLSKPG